MGVLDSNMFETVRYNYLIRVKISLDNYNDVFAPEIVKGYEDKSNIKSDWPIVRELMRDISNWPEYMLCQDQIDTLTAHWFINRPLVTIKQESDGAYDIQIKVDGGSKHSEYIQIYLRHRTLGKVNYGFEH